LEKDLPVIESRSIFITTFQDLIGVPNFIIWWNAIPPKPEA